MVKRIAYGKLSGTNFQFGRILDSLKGSASFYKEDCSQNANNSQEEND